MDDSIFGLAANAAIRPDSGQHRVVNLVTETRYSINEIAEKISSCASQLGYKVVVDSSYDPRREQPAEKLKYDIVTDDISSYIEATPLSDVIMSSTALVHEYRDAINVDAVAPKIEW